MPFSREVEERRKEREEKRRQAELDRRREEDMLQQKEAESRAQALEEARQRDAAWDTVRAQREAQLQSIRSRKRTERRAVEREALQHEEQIDHIRTARRQETTLEQEKLSRMLALRNQQAGSRQAERQEAEKAAEKRQAFVDAAQEAAHQERVEEERSAEKAAAQESERTAVQRQANLQAARQERLGERLAGERETERRQAVLEQARQAKKSEEQAASRQAENAAAERQAARQERLEERTARERETEKRLASLEESRQARLDQQQAFESDAQTAAAKRQAALEDARQKRLEERSQELREAERRQAALKEARQARMAEQRQAENDQDRLAGQRLAASSSRPLPPRSSDQDAGSRSERPASPAASPEPRDPFQDPIPSGRLSGSLPWLRVTGRQVTNIFGDPILLHGVNLLGMEAAAPHPLQGFSAGAGINSATITGPLSWGANVLRVAINRSRVLHGFGDWSAWDYLSDLDEIIHQAAAGGAYTLLSLRRLDDVTVFGTRPGPGGERLPNYIAPMPDYDSIGMWRVLGERYASEPAVLFDLYTAPHPPLEDDLSGFTSDWDLWTLWVQVIAADLRRLHPRALIFVSGLVDGTDLSGFPILGTAGEPVPNLVYTAHLYPRRADPLRAVQSLARTHPIFVSEWGGSLPDLLWGERTELALRSKGFGWTASFWNSEPALTQTVNNQVTPTPFGALVRRALALAGEPLAAQQQVLPPSLSNLSIG